MGIGEQALTTDAFRPIAALPESQKTCPELVSGVIAAMVGLRPLNTRIEDTHGGGSALLEVSLAVRQILTAS